MIDRLTQKYVVEFLYFKLIDFPIFNVADIYVTVAAFAMIFFGLFYYKEEDFNQIFPSKKPAEKFCATNPTPAQKLSKTTAKSISKPESSSFTPLPTAFFRSLRMKMSYRFMSCTAIAKSPAEF